jgi:hypothetical protein
MAMIGPISQIGIGGESHDSAPPTPPYKRVRIRRFGGLGGTAGINGTRPSERIKAFGIAIASAGLLLRSQGPRPRHRLMCRAPRPKAEAMLGKRPIPVCLQHLHHRLL